MKRLTDSDRVTLICKIQRMFLCDQAMREKNLRKPKQWDDTVDRHNTKSMKKIIGRIGWPTVSKVGKTASRAAALLVIHADRDISFQKSCLRRMKHAADSSATSPDSRQVDLADIAYLEDRIRVNEGRPQVYGTQFTQTQNRHVPRPIANAAEVDARRASMGLPTLKSAIRHMYRKYPMGKA